MAVNVSPGVYTRIVDLSEYVRQVPSTIGFIPIICEQGPDNQLVLTNSNDFFLDFGEPDINYVGKNWGSGPYVASSFLTQSDSLYVVRCMPDDAQYAVVPFSSDSVVVDSSAETYVDWTETTIDGPTNTDTLDTWLTTGGGGTKDPCFVFYSVGRGAFYNQFQIQIERPSDSYKSIEENMYIVSIYKRKDNFVETSALDAGTYEYAIVEQYQVSVDPTQLDSGGGTAFIEDVINNNSRYVRVKANADNCARAVANNANFASPTFTPSSVTSWPTNMGGPSVNLVSMDGGLLDSDGNVVASVAKNLIYNCYLGTLNKPTDNTTDLDDIIDKEKIYFSLVFDGGYPDKDIKGALVSLTTTRGDCLAVTDNGDNATPTAALSRRSSTNSASTAYTSSLNYRAVAIYEGYTKVYDGYTGRDIWITPVFHMAKILPYTDNVSEVWYAPAGFNRALISNVKEMRYNPRLSVRDSFYLAQLNPIVRFQDVGDVVFGQLTSQRRPTALQDVNVVRMVLYVQRAIEQFCKYYIFEQNDEDTWGAIATQINSFLGVVQQRRGIREFTVDVGSTEYEYKSKKIHVNITIVPTKVVEQINITFFIKN